MPRRAMLTRSYAFARTCLGSHTAVASWMKLCCNFQWTGPYCRDPDLQALIIFSPPILWCTLNVKHSSYVVDVNNGAGNTVISNSLHLDQFLFSVLVLLL